ncbi:alpha-2 adrenergic receptor isoform X2 [Drosophila sulfurigaster albostrigata]|nr:alpha-2 adrenergic receptor isoform X2 [Drosophila nasuta]XP_062123007.1 alpha-2 adrenergic receptor isoform X2 [Drosophila sulfurigaster albostrigata]
MDYAKVEASINTGNISTDDFLAVFTSGTTTTTAATLAAAAIGSTISSSSSSSSGTLNPPLVTVDGQVQLPNLLDLQSPVNDTIYLLNGSFYNNSLQLAGSYYNQTTGNQSSGLGGLLGNSSNATEVHWDGRYPSGYTLTHIVIASIIVTILMIIIVVGNMLVIIAIATEKSLKNIQNWFIASLAVADFFLGLIIMPFSLANELMGYWIFGSWWCDIHSAMDVLLCTASIMNLCLISLDRYWSITKAVDYLKSRTPARAAVMITAVWIMSALICIPPLLGWKVKMPEGDLPKCEVRW